MDSHFAGALPGARATLAREFPGLTLDVHSADIWAGDEHELNNCKAAIASADIIITTMLFLEDHISLVLPALYPGNYIR
ncbi:MAG TPA: DUF3479 domain-containing protein, partial [Acetobacteraceae bacterium]|nr:DUF3479 domain-containing protein [Acetobacteraceae bacterium]